MKTFLKKCEQRPKQIYEKDMSILRRERFDVCDADGM
jgi:hypothetical protein